MQMLLSPDAEARPIPGPRPRVGVLASGAGSNFEALCAAVNDGALEVDIAALVCNVEGAGAVEVARRFGVPAEVVRHGDFDARASFDLAVRQALEAREVEWVVMAGWMRLVGEGFLRAFGGRVLNIHPSLLPAYRGLRAVEQALEGGARVTGCTAHLVVAEVDSGPIVAQAAVPVLPGDDAATLHARIKRAEHIIYPVALSRAIRQARLAGEPTDVTRDPDGGI